MTSGERMLAVIESSGDYPLDGGRTARAPSPPDPLSALFDAHYGAVHAYLRRRAPADVADELAVATFEVAWRRWAELPAAPLPWLYAVARRLLANQRRGDQRRSRLRSRLTALRGHRSAPPAASSEVDPAGTALDALAAREALDRLRPDDRELLMLVAWGGLDAGAAAASLGITPAAFAVRLHRARRRLENLLPTATPAKDLP